MLDFLFVFEIMLSHIALFLHLFIFACAFFILFFYCFQEKKKKKKKKKIEKYKNIVCFVYIGTCIPWMAFETKFLNFVSLVA